MDQSGQTEIQHKPNKFNPMNLSVKVEIMCQREPFNDRVMLAGGSSHKLPFATPGLDTSQVGF